jgi:hypothetical protein
VWCPRLDRSGFGALPVTDVVGASSAVAIDDEAVYYHAKGWLVRVCLDGSAPPEHLAQPGVDDYSVQVDESGVYFDGDEGGASGP